MLIPPMDTGDLVEQSVQAFAPLDQRAGTETLVHLSERVEQTP